MDLERRLISRALYDLNFDAVLSAGVTAEMFGYPDNRTVFRFLERCQRKYGRVTPRMVKEAFPYYTPMVDVKEPLEYCIDGLRKAYQLDILSEAGNLISDALDAKDPELAQKLMAEAVRTSTDAVPEPRTVNINDVVGDYLEMFLSRGKNGPGLIGIPTGFTTMNNVTLGFQASQLVTVAGLAGAGKSTLLMLMAQHIQAAGKIPFFMSFEMSEEEQVARYLAMGAGLSYNALVSGKVSDDQEAAVRAFSEEVKKQCVFSLCTDIARSSTVSGLEKSLGDRLPDIALVDGVYLMRDDETKMRGSDSKAMTNITRDLKQMAQRLEIPVVISTQALPSKTTKVSRNSEHRRLDMYSPGYTSSFAQDSDVLFGLEKDERNQTERLLRILKARHSSNSSIWIQWDWRRGRFGKELRVEDGEYEVEDEEEDEP